jgi:hypothetical protein
LEASRQVIERQTKDKFKNGKEYARLTKTLFQNLMLNRRILKIEESLVGHKSFLPQEMVQRGRMD